MFRQYLLIAGMLLATISAYGNTISTEQDPKSTTTTSNKATDNQTAEADHIVISKERMSLEVYDTENRLICSFPVSLGKNYGNKQEMGDLKTPEGDFSIVQIQRASHWLYNTGKESIKGYYGNWFIRLDTEHRSIGIHGTHAPELIGERCTEGSIRLNNDHLDTLHSMIKVGMAVRIESSHLDRESDGKEVAEVEMPSISVETALPITDNNASPVLEQTTEVESTVGNTTASNQEVEKKSAEVAKTPAKTTKVEEEWYTVKDGDLVGRIAADHGISISDIKRLNPDMNIDRISIGQKIKVKGEMTPIAEEEKKPAPAPTVEPKAGEVWHTVEDGDLVGRIAEKYGTTTRQIKELNPELNVDRISIGQRIRVK